MNVVELHDVSKSFGDVRAVKNLSVNVPERTIFGLIGPNGSGKTTTMRMMLGIILADAGSIRLMGSERKGSRRHDIGYLPEERGIYRKMTVRDLLHFFAELRSGNRSVDQVNYWLAKFDLLPWAGAKIESLSKGMTQKVQFIAAVIPRPTVLILDEPFAGLDPVNVEIIRDAILELRANGSSIILSTHDMNIAETLCETLCMISQGKKVLDGTPDSIRGQYGQDVLRVKTADGAAAVGGLPFLESVRDLGNAQEIRLQKDGDPQVILGELMRRTRIESFEITRPSLHDIFIRIVRGENGGVPDA